MTAALYVRVRGGLTYVPQHISTDVTKLNLQDNEIEVLNRSSFALFQKMNWLNLDNNPLTIINNGTFDNNSLLAEFRCFRCEIKVLPVSFGPAASQMKRLMWSGGIRDMRCITPTYFQQFTSLTGFGMFYNKFRDISHIKIPPSIRTLGSHGVGLSRVPNLSSLRFPELTSLHMGLNNLGFFSDSTLAGMNKDITLLLRSDKLVEIGNVAIFVKLYFLDLRWNDLETIPDLLALPRLGKLYIGGNTRMTCDRRLCWRALWDRVRSRLYWEDDVKCKAPSAVRGHRLSRINPGFMQCDQGGCCYQLLSL